MLNTLELPNGEKCPNIRFLKAKVNDTNIHSLKKGFSALHTIFFFEKSDLKNHFKS